jgi:hypothetical protein
LDDAEPNADRWARPEETRERIVELHRSTWELTDATIDELPVDGLGRVWWWRQSRQSKRQHGSGTLRSGRDWAPWIGTQVWSASSSAVECVMLVADPVANGAPATIIDLGK